MKTFLAMRSLHFAPQVTTYSGSGPTRRASPIKMSLRSLKDARVLLTFDKNFGELAWRSGLPASCGIVLFRLPAGLVAAALTIEDLEPVATPDSTRSRSPNWLRGMMLSDYDPNVNQTAKFQTDLRCGA